MKKALFLTLVLTLLPLHLTQAAMFYSDPAVTSTSGDGSAAKPFPGLQVMVENGLLAKVQSGDALMLRPGYHGRVRIKRENAKMTYIGAAPNTKVKLGELDVDGSNWCFRGLEIAPPSEAEEKIYSREKSRPASTLVTLGEHTPSTNLVIENCYINGGHDSSQWSIKEWMSAVSGIYLGRHGKKLVAQNNYLANLRFGLTVGAPDSKVLGNVITDFSGDGMRVLRDGITVEYNVIRNCHVSDSDGDKNHDDAIQCFRFNDPGKEVNGITIRKNYIASWDKKVKHPSNMQAIGFFDGPLTDFLVEGNVVNIDHWHGIALYDAQRCTIRDNVVYDEWTDNKMRPWIMLGTKKRITVKENSVVGNYCNKYVLPKGSTKEAKNNAPCEKSLYTQRRAALLTEIEKKFGKLHPVAKLPRLE